MTPDLLESLIARDLPAAQRGDTQAYGRLVGATQRMVASVALAVTRDVHTSEDIAQETFLTAWQRIGQLGNPQSFLPWLRQVARNRAIDHVRAQRYRETPTDPLDTLATLAVSPQRGPAEQFVSDEDARQLAEALDEIPETSRDVLLLYYREGEDTREVAALLGITDAAVRKRLQRGRDSLREEWLRRFADTARSSAPGVAFTAALGLAVAGMSPAPAVAAGLGLGASKLGLGGKSLLAALGAFAAAIGLVVGAVWLETRYYLRRAKSDAARRAIKHNGWLYAALMSTYISLLVWARHAQWSGNTLLAMAGVFSLLIVLVTLERRRHMRRR
ncbi:MAG: sigma-70 family RNA polymerase sigma factor [Arenimonas sp.]|uniref:RNA polymerase sigma factor n=1 Tax=Arenimonas sp. TaxID=1872635 RepID=UPI0025BFF388|nr:sigma-70 family RNA polymerase sigma factor [Arenimonas sp.]MBW8368338.1 sigma-70 family RNA polymerase sigma factor [Arenimonas sp.]